MREADLKVRSPAKCMGLRQVPVAGDLERVRGEEREDLNVDAVLTTDLVSVSDPTLDVGVEGRLGLEEYSADLRRTNELAAATLRMKYPLHTHSLTWSGGGRSGWT